MLFTLAIENLVNFSFQQFYNGPKAFPEATNTNTALNYYGNTVLLFGGISKHLSHRSITIRALCPLIKYL